MNFKALIQGGALSRDLRREASRLETAQGAALSEATTGLKTTLRGQITSAGLGSRLAGSWRSKLYIDGKTSAGFVYSRAPHIVEAFDKGVTIRATHGRYLAIPTQNAPKRGTDGKRINPTNFPKKLGPLVLIKTRGHLFLAVNNVRASYSKDGQLRGFRAASNRARASGKGLASAIMFILIPQSRLPKKLDVKGAATLWANRLPAMIDSKVAGGAL